MSEYKLVPSLNFELDQLTEEFIAELDDKTVLIISGGNRGIWAQILNSKATVMVDRAEYEAMKADAERYGWLRDQNADLEDDTFVVLGHDCTEEETWQKYWVGSDLDQAIDQARKI